MRTEVILLALIVAASGCVHVATDSEPAPDAQPDTETAPSDEKSAADSSDGNTIYLTPSGFQPSDLTVQQGETVTWINNASQPMWVASDRHPTHTNYAGSSRSEHCQNNEPTGSVFDQCSSGDRYSFTFEKTGEWGYHNHENAAQGGTITVE